MQEEVTRGAVTLIVDGAKLCCIRITALSHRWQRQRKAWSIGTMNIPAGMTSMSGTNAQKTF